LIGLNNQRVIIFGGTENALSAVNLDINDSLYILKLNNFEWDVAKVSGQVPLSSRNFHQANVIGNYIIISFGK
jgi:hypothetical protein